MKAFAQRFLLLIFCLVSVQVLFAAPYTGQIEKYTLPDGSTVSVSMYGDEYYGYFTSLDGATLVRKNGWFFYAQLNNTGDSLVSTGVKYTEDIQQARSLQFNRTTLKLKGEAVKKQIAKSKSVLLNQQADSLISSDVSSVEPLYGESSQVVKGAFKGLAILIDFSDQPATISQSEIDNYFNQTGYSGFSNNGSVRDYFRDVSNGNVDYTNIVTAYYRAAHPKWYYDTATLYGRSVELMKEALDYIAGTQVDFDELSMEGENNVIAVNFFYAGVRSQGWSYGLWPHKRTLNYTVSSNGKTYKISSVQMSDIGNSLSLGTVCHETGHLLMKWPDLYDRDGSSSGLSRFCLMSGGGHGTNPTAPNLYLRQRSGWQVPIVLNDIKQTTTLDAPANAFVSYQYSNPSNDREFFLVENIQSSGRWANTYANGMLIWHVDEGGNNDYDHMTPSLHYMVSLEQADGAFDLENGFSSGNSDCFFDGNNNAFNDETVPNANWWNGFYSGLNIQSISAASSNMTFTYVVPYIPEIEEDPAIVCAVNSGSSLSFAVASSFAGTKAIVDWGNGSLKEYVLDTVPLVISGQVYDSVKIYCRFISHFATTGLSSNIRFLRVSNAHELECLDIERSYLSNLNVSANQKLRKLVCSNNVLQYLDVSANALLEILDCSGTLIQDIDLSQNKELHYLTCDASRLKTLDISANTNLSQLNCAFNNLTIASLPLPSPLFQLYSYTEQRPFSLPKYVYNKNEPVDLSEQLLRADANGDVHRTVYSWFYADGSALIKGVDYYEYNGVFVFKSLVQDSVFCHMQNDLFPSFRLKTYGIYIKEYEPGFYVNFGNSKNWGVWNGTLPYSAQGSTIVENVRDAVGNKTGISMHLATAVNILSTGVSTGNNSGVFPDDVLSSGYWKVIDDVGGILFSGLDTAYAYTFYINGARSCSDSRIARYSVLDKIVLLETRNNTQNVAVIESVVPADNGELTLLFSPSQTAAFAYINGLKVVKEEKYPLVDSLTGVSVQFDADSGVVLTWDVPAMGARYVEIVQSGESDNYYLADPYSGFYAIDGLIPNAEYQFTVTAYNGSESTTPVVLSAVVGGQAFADARNVFLDFANPNAVAPWNGSLFYASGSGSVFTNVLDSDGNETGISVATDVVLSGKNFGHITGDNSGVFPDEVLKNGFWLQKGNTARFVFSGLNSDYYYTFKITGSRTGVTDSRISVFSVGDSEDSFDAANNTNAFAHIEKVECDSDGEITLLMSCGTGSSYAYVNGLELSMFPKTVEKLAAPSLFVAAEIASSSILLSWKNNSVAEGVAVERLSGNSFVPVGIVAGDAVAFRDTGLVPGETYVYRLYAFNNSEKSDYSKELVVETKQLLLAPLNFRADSVFSRAVYLAWENTVGSSIVQVFRSQGGSFFEIAQCGNPVSSYVDIEVEPGKAYCYKLRAVNSFGEYSDFTQDLFVTASSVAVQVPTAPTNLVASSVTAQSACLLWHNTCDAQGIVVERSSGGSFTVVATVAGTSSQYVDSGLHPATEYVYRLKAYDASGVSEYSDLLTVLTEPLLDAPIAPVGLVVDSLGATYVSMSWHVSSSSAVPESFIIQRSVGNGAYIEIAEVVSSYYFQFDLIPETSYTYRVYAKNKAGLSLPAELSFSTLASTVETEKYSVLLDFANPNAVAPWNGSLFYASGSGSVFANVADTDGNKTGITVTTDVVLNGKNFGHITGDNSGIFPDAVLKNGYWLQKGNTARFVFSGLDSDYYYTFKIAGSRTGVTDSRISVFSVGDSEDSFDAANNTNAFAHIEKVECDSDGEIVLLMSCGAGSSYSYINGIELQAVSKNDAVFSVPIHLIAKQITSNAVDLEWDRLLSCSEINVQRKDGSDYITIAKLGGESVQYSDKGLVAGQIYTYRLQAVVNSGLVVYSNVLSVVAESVIVSGKVPETPANFRVLSSTPFSVELGWDRATDADVATYSVLRADSVGVFHVVAEVPSSVLNYTDNEVRAGGCYLYALAALNVFGESVPVQLNVSIPVVVDLPAFCVLFDFANKNALLPWNSSLFDSYGKGAVFANVKDTDGKSTGISVSTPTAVEGNANGAQTGDNSGLFPDPVLKTAYYVSASNRSESFVFSGLRQDYTYSLKIIGSRGSISEDRITVYGVGSIFDSVNVASNSEHYALLQGVEADSNGEFILTMLPGNGASYAYINGLELTAIPKPVANPDVFFKSLATSDLSDSVSECVVYPSVVSGYFTIVIKDTAQIDASVSVVSSSGVTVASYLVTQPESLLVLPPFIEAGVYAVLVECGEVKYQHMILVY